MNNFLVQKFFKQCIFTWNILSTLGSKCVLAANNFSLITIFFVYISCFPSQNTRSEFAHILIYFSFFHFSLLFLLLSIRFNDGGKNYSGNQHSNFFPFHQREKKASAKTRNRLLHDCCCRCDAYGIEQKKKKEHHVHRALFVSRRNISLHLLNRRSSVIDYNMP